MESSDQKAHRVRGIYLLPNLFTIGAMFAGFYAIVAGMHGLFQDAAIAIFVAILMDGLDGRVARLTNSQSEFGAQLDSLSDMVSFGITPAMVLYGWSLSSLGKIGWLAAFFYAMCTALRLARFNTQLAQPNKRYFQGLATPAAAAAVGSLIWVCSLHNMNGALIAWPVAAIAVILAFLKVSTIRYRSFKDFDLRNSVPFVVILMFVLVLLFISFDPADVLFAASFIYVFSGPLGTVWMWQKHKRRHAHLRLLKSEKKHDS